MKRIQILSIRKNTNSHIATLESEYIKRLRASHKIDLVDIRQTYGNAMDSQLILTKEASLWTDKLKKTPQYIAMDPQGKTYSSEAFSAWLAKQTFPLTFLIGGPHGLPPSIRNKASQTISLSSMTLTHEMTRLVLLEQLYRAVDIQCQGNYHK